MIVRHSPGVRRLTLGADKGYDAAAFVADMRALNVTPRIAQNRPGSDVPETELLTKVLLSWR